MLPEYGFRTIFRMFISLIISLIFTFIIAPLAAKNKHFEKRSRKMFTLIQSVTNICTADLAEEENAKHLQTKQNDDDSEPIAKTLSEC